MTKEEMQKFKFKYDKLLDDIFFTNDFKNYIVEKCKYCPDGLTIDTNVDGDEPVFAVCTKKYGFEFMGERVPGDYYDLVYGVDEQFVINTLKYLGETDIELYKEIFKYDVRG